MKSKYIRFLSYLPQKFKHKPCYNLNEKAMFHFVCACGMLQNKNTHGKKHEQRWCHHPNCLTFSYRGWV